VHGVGGLVIGYYNNRWNLRGAREEGNIEGAGRGGESGNTTATTGKRQVPSCLFKGRGTLQVRQQLADKGEDHAGCSLAAVVEVIIKQKTVSLMTENKSSFRAADRASAFDSKYVEKGVASGKGSSFKPRSLQTSRDRRM
jgi:hypothetical protein